VGNLTAKGKGGFMNDGRECMVAVNSSLFSKAGYNSDLWALFLQFKSTGETRMYTHVSPEVGDEVLNAESLGKYFNANIKANAAWTFEILGAEEPAEPAPKPAVKQDERGLTDEDLDAFFDHIPETAAPQRVELQPGIHMNETVDCPPKQMHVSEVGDYPQDFGVKEFDPQTGHWPNSAINEDGSIKEEAIEEATATMTRQPVGEVLSAWTAPESAAEALDLLAEREGEINAIIAQSKATGEQALTVKVDSAEKRLAASDTLTKLVAKKDLTSKALDPFRKVLYDAYTEAGAKVKAGVDPLEKGINHIKSQILSWDQAEERKRQQLIREDNERRDAEARRLQEAEQERIRLADVQDKLDEGDEKGAQLLFEAPPVEVPRPYVAPTYIPPAAPKVEGQSTSTTWKVDRSSFEEDKDGQLMLASITKMLTAIKDGSYEIAQAAPLLEWNFSKCDKRAESMMSAFNVPGLTAAPKSSLRVGGGRRKKS
jgi:KTSC domain